jgi:hypothetical protein
LSRLHTEHLTIEQAIECAVYTIEEVKKIDTDCGGPVRAVGVSKQGIQTRSSDELRELSSSLSARDELLSRVWRYMVLGRKKADEIAAFLESRECAETAGAGLEPPPG